MSAVWLRLRSEFRARWRSWVGLALIIGFAAGAAMTLALAARRSQQAYRVFSDDMAAADVVMTGASAFGLVGGVDLDAVTKTGFVAESARAFVALPFSGRTDDGKRLDATTVFPLAAEDGRLGSSLEQWKMLAGRPADPAVATEAVASFVLAERLGLHVGSRLDIRFYASTSFVKTAVKLLAGLAPRIAERQRAHRAEPDYADGPRVELRIVGIEASPAEFPPLLTDLAPVLHLTPAFAHRYERVIVGSPVGYMKLRPGRSVDAFQLAVERLAAGKPVSFVSKRALQAPKVQRSIHVEALGLALVAALVGLAGIVGIGQAMTRQTLAESDQLSTLRALGMRDRQIVAMTVARLVGISVVGAVLASAVAIFVSQYALLPLARKAELHAGPHVDLTVLAIGVVAIVGLSLVIAIWSSRNALRSSHPASDPMAGPERRRHHLIASGGPIGALWLPVTLGVRFALQRARRAVPAWATILALGLTVAVLGGALMFTTNLRRLLDEPHRYGWNWDVKLGAPGLPDLLRGPLQTALDRDANIAALSAGTVTQISLDDVDRIDVLALDRIRGDAVPTMLAGRPPDKTTEIALGAKTMRKLQVHIGDSVEARIGRRSQYLRVVGQSVMPEFGDAGQLGTGSLMTFAGIRRLLPGAPDNTFLVRFGRDAADERARMATAVEPIPTHVQARPADLVDLARGSGLLAALVVFLAVLGFVLLAHALVTSVRARRRDLAVLRSIGMTRRQIVETVLGQALTLTVGALVVGLVAGAVLGRMAWRGFAHNQGVASDAVVSTGVLLAIAAGALVVALAAAVVPAAIAARSHPTRALRAE